MTTPPEPTPRIAIIGASGYATVYIDWLVEAHNNGTIYIVAATILPAEQGLTSAKALIATSAKLYDNYESMFENERGKLDLCFIPTSIHWHSRMAIAALESGCNALVEKPLAGSIEDIEAVQAAEKRFGRWVAVGFQDMYTPEIVGLKQTLLNGGIGKIKSISMLGVWPRPKSYYTRNYWAGKLRSDGAAVLDSPLNNAFAHFVNLSLFLAGDELHESIDAVIDKSELYHAHEIENFDTAVVQATAKNGIQLWFGVTHACSETREPCIRIIGENGNVIWKHEQTCTTSPLGQKPSVIQVPKYETTRQNMFERVLMRLRDSTVSICDCEIAKCQTRLIESLYKSSHIQTIPKELIDLIPLDGTDSEVPSIRNIVPMLEQAFEKRGNLGDITRQLEEV